MKNTYGKEQSDDVVAFLNEIVAVCKKHGMALSHEDGHGAFEIEPFDEYDEDWRSWIEGAVDRRTDRR